MASRRAHVVRETAPRFGTECRASPESLTKSDAEAIERGRRAVAAGDYLTPDEVRHELARPRRVARGKNPRSRTRR